MIPSSLGKAPPQIKRIFLVLIVVSGTMAFLLVAPTGTSTSAPSKSFNSPCCTDSPLTSLWLEFFFLAILSISSIKTIHGAFSLACLKRSRTREAPTPTNISTKSEPDKEKNGTLASPATAFANNVFPVPGGPTNKAPLGILPPKSV